MTATLPTHFSPGTPTPDSPNPGAFGPGGPAQPSLSGYDEFLPTGRTPLGDYLTFFWLPRRLPGWAEGTRRYRTWTVNTLLESSLAARAIEDLTVLEIERYFAHRAITPWDTTGELPKAGSLKGLHDTLRASLNDAKKYGFIRDNPCTGVELPRAESTQAKIWTPEQVQSFLESTRRSRYVTLWRLLFATGLRRGEALGLQWADVDLAGRRLTVRRNLQADSREGNVRYGPPKSRRSTRTITIDPGTAEALERWRRMRETEHGAWLADLEKRLNGYRTPGARLPELPRQLPDDSPVFANPDGTPMLPSTVSDTFRRQVAKSGLPVMRLHDARHTHLTHLLRSGEPIQNVSARAGHGSSFTTLTTYAHVIAGDDERTAARAAGLFGD